MSKHLNELNEQQKKAVLQKDGPVMIIAGAGAGKTKTITHRILNLIQEGTNPSSILAVTFTNKAAKEMRKRIEKMLIEDKKVNFPTSQENLENKPFISTFHSLGVHILKENAQEIGLTRYFNIFDRNDSKRAIKESLNKSNIDPKQFEPAKILSVISRQKGNFITHEKYSKNVGNEYFKQIVSTVWNNYEKILFDEKSLDFDDLLLKSTLLLKENKNIREKYQNQWKYIHIDEYQDTNKVQYEMSRLLVGENKNICAVADGDQCLLPSTKIETKEGKKRIDKIKKGDEIISASGRGDTTISKILAIKKRKYNGEIIEIKTKKGFILKSTPEHITFSKFSLNTNVYYTYLMYRKDKGFRIGVVKGVRKTGRPNGQMEKNIGFMVRSNQEKADRMWVLKVSKNKSDAIFWENYFASKYGIPLVVFFDNGRKLSLNQKLINKLFKKIDTEKRAIKLFKELNLYFNYPHYIPQGTTQLNTEKKRINVKLTMFSDTRKTLSSPWCASRVSINTTDIKLKNKLKKAGFSINKGKKTDWRIDFHRLNYKETENIVQKILNLDKNLILNRSAFITNNKKFDFMPAGSLHPTMKIGFYRNGKIEEELIISIKKTNYKGFVYDLNIKNTHNYIAENIVVHNCIYGWRGADHTNIFNFEKNFKNTKTILLEQNYRSTQTILTVANDIIRKNKIRKDKNLFTKNEEGEKISLISGYNEQQESQNVVQNIKKLLKKGVSANEIAVLYRANFQSRVLEEFFLIENVPYQVLGTKFFERKEIKDVISFIKAGLNPESLVDVKRIINVPPRGIGKITILKLFSGKENELSPAMQLKIDKFRILLKNIEKKVLTKKPSDVIRFVIKESGLEEKLKKGTDEDLERLGNIGELITLATKYDYLEAPTGIEKLLENAVLATDQDEIDSNKEQKNVVKLMTVHTSKGLEFDYVFITGLEDTLFPSKRFGEKQTESQKEEERRLFYVALTRAKKKLYLSHSSVRTIFGSKQMNPPSEFILEIDKNLTEEENMNDIENNSDVVYLDLDEI